MDVMPRGHDTVVRLMEKGVTIPNPLSLDIGPEVDPERISGRGVVIYPGCRIYGATTVLSAGATLGAEGPVTLDSCRLGPRVELKGGYFKKSVFLEKANMGLGAHVREGTLLEEEANGAHTVGLKQTILFPFVTLGSLINFCDCLMAGGTSRKDHSEVGSSYIHFNFTPDGNKTTASLFGDVPRGVLLNQPPIFLGGQGGAVGPLRVGYGTVVAAGSVLRDDVRADRRLVIAAPHPGMERPFTPHAYRSLARVVGHNLLYLANLVALEQWYRQVRRPFFEAQELGPLVYEGALDMVGSAIEERTKRLLALVGKVSAEDGLRRELTDHAAEVCALFTEHKPVLEVEAPGILREAMAARIDVGYVAAVQSLPAEAAGAAVGWLQGMVDEACARAAARLPSLGEFTAA